MKSITRIEPPPNALELPQKNVGHADQASSVSIALRAAQCLAMPEAQTDTAWGLEMSIRTQLLNQGAAAQQHDHRLEHADRIDALLRQESGRKLPANGRELMQLAGAKARVSLKYMGCLKESCGVTAPRSGPIAGGWPD